MSSRIASVEAIPVRLARNTAAARGTAGTPTAMGQQSGGYRWSAVYPVLYSEFIETTLVKIVLDNGVFGWGEAQAPVAPRVSATIVEDILAPVLEGEEFDGSPARIEALWTRMYSTMRVRGQTGGFMLDAISGVDLALWDLGGKLLGLPVAKMLCEMPKTTIPAYMSGVPEGSVEFARARCAEGFRNFKVYHDSDVAELLPRLDALRAEVPRARFALDALWRFEWPLHRDLITELRTRDLLWLECPFPPEEIEWHRELSGISLALGESYRTACELRPFFSLAKYIQPDLGRCGITETMRIARHAEHVVPHVSIALGPQIAAAIHVSAALSNCPLCEYNPNVFEVSNRFLHRPLEFEEAAYKVPGTPGLGIEIREADLCAAQAPSAWR